MGNCVKSTGEIEKEEMYLFMVVFGGSPVMDCLHDLGLAGEPWLEAMQVMEYNVVSIEVFPHVAKNDIVHPLAYNTC